MISIYIYFGSLFRIYSLCLFANIYRTDWAFGAVTKLRIIQKILNETIQSLLNLGVVSEMGSVELYV